MGEEGLEKVSESQGKATVSDQLAQKLAQFPICTLWEALGDEGQALLFSAAVAIIEAGEAKV